MINIRRVVLLVVLCVQEVAMLSAASTPFLRPYDYMFFPRKWPEQRASLLNMGAAGFSPHAYNALGDKVNAFQMWNPTQDALAMLKGFPLTTVQGQTAQAITFDGDNGIRGNFLVTGNFEIPLSYAGAFRYNITPDWTVAAFLPAHVVSASHISWIDLTPSTTADDILIKQLITNNFAANVALWGDGLSLESWSKAGVGDFSCAICWSKEFKQYKQYIKTAVPRASFGLSFPTGVQADSDKPLSMAFGFDGAYAAIFDIGLYINFSHWLDVGFNCEFIQAFMHTKQRRIKIDVNQTELLLLTKTAVTKDLGLIQRFNLFAEAHFNDALSLRFLYNYIRHSASTLYVVSNEYSSLIANTAPSVDQWTAHSIIFQLRMDTATEEDQRYKPQMFVFWKHPFNGKRSVAMNYIGAGLELTF